MPVDSMTTVRTRQIAEVRPAEQLVDQKPGPAYADAGGFEQASNGLNLRRVALAGGIGEHRRVSRQSFIRVPGNNARGTKCGWGPVPL